MKIKVYFLSLLFFVSVLLDKCSHGGPQTSFISTTTSKLQTTFCNYELPISWHWILQLNHNTVSCGPHDYLFSVTADFQAYKHRKTGFWLVTLNSSTYFIISFSYLTNIVQIGYLKNLYMLYMIYYEHELGVTFSHL